MSFFINQDLQDALLNQVKNNCNKMAVLSAYTVGDSYATANGNILSEVTMASGDFTLGSTGNVRELTVASKQQASANATGTAAVVAFLDTVNSKVLWVTDETNSAVITIGLQVVYPATVLRVLQPVAP
jgi:hypothetical protein